MCGVAARSTLRVTKHLQDWRDGDDTALDRLIPLVYAELRRIARRQMRGERRDSIRATELVGEVYLRLAGSRRVNWQDRAHFFAMAARIMRRVLVDAARRRNMQKRGGGMALVTFNEELVVIERGREPDILALDDALTALAELNPRKARVVELRYFAGLTIKETAEVLDVSEDTVARDWDFARPWLERAIRKASR
jgi:RNA polymerase sigma factor (TIGR02999 family)